MIQPISVQLKEKELETEKDISKISTSVNNLKTDNSQKMSQNNTININITSAPNDLNLSNKIALSISEELNKLSRTTFRFHSGMSLTG